MTRVLVDDVMKTIAERYDVTIEELASEGRSCRITGARAAGYWLARRVTGQSFPAIGRGFRKDHTSVLRGVKRMEDERTKSPSIAEELALLELAARARVGAASHPAEKCLEHIDTARIALSVLEQRGYGLRPAEAVALARAYLTGLRNSFSISEPLPAEVS